eukprot:CAMPEP_0202015784 /NCGR_PEP_ID=MMETSP0905-20130828/32901_1 /ASSEMBLY_ACC=CAM_ASM_000554 /TAXON_ID=420261 /ORGANISM="Thalassiosira antarctica, Strain CCMP982" /LENGTH=79 /DNA_ID=CAMNT_0048576035 /DNA_START=96 /DNA_END=332 /DNA_ORIENTATION=-
MNSKPVVSEEVEVEDVLSEEESDGESSDNSSMPPLEDNVVWPQPASFPVVDATTRPNNIGPMVGSLVRNVLALAEEGKW